VTMTCFTRWPLRGRIGVSRNAMGCGGLPLRGKPTCSWGLLVHLPRRDAPATSLHE
jgi:hypothetical protein